MNRSLALRYFTTLAGIMLIVACGKKGIVKLDTKVGSETPIFRAENASFGDSTAATEPASTLRANISNPAIHFSTFSNAVRDPFGQSLQSYVPRVRVSIITPKGETAETRIREGEKIDWDFNLTWGDGDYEIRGELGKVINGEFKPSELRWSRFVRLDTSSPKILGSAALSSTPNGAGRTLLLRASVTDITPVTCHGTIEPGIQIQASTIPFELGLDTSVAAAPAAPTTTSTSAAATPSSTSATPASSSTTPSALTSTDSAAPEQKFISTNIAIPDSYPSRIHARFSCADTFQHSAEIVEVASFDQPQFNLDVALDAPLGVPYENSTSSNAQQVYLLKTGTAADGSSTKIKILPRIVDKVAFAPIPEAVMNREKIRLQIYLSDFEMTDLAQVKSIPAGKHLYMRKVFAESLEGVIPATLVESTKLYVTLSHLHESTGTENLISSRPVDIYVEPMGARWNYTWISARQFIPAQQNAQIPLRVKMQPATGKGTLLNGNPKVEYSINNETWTEIAATDWSPVSGVADDHTFKIQYPFAEEKPFRVRLKGTTMLGNESVSIYSKNLVSPTGFVVGGASASACSAGTGVRAQLGSSFLCQREIAGVRRYSYVAVLDSMGENPFSIAADASRLCGSDYCFEIVETQGPNTTKRKINADAIRAPSFKRSNHGRALYFLGEYAATDFTALTNLSVAFKLNNESCAATPEPSFVVKSSTQVAGLSPFLCD